MLPVHGRAEIGWWIERIRGSGRCVLQTSAVPGKRNRLCGHLFHAALRASLLGVRMIGAEPVQREL
ncbi:MAG: hypothetical protein AAFO62_08600, partial [Pseudomonadota bacterium]